MTRLDHIRRELFSILDKEQEYLERKGLTGILISLRFEPDGRIRCHSVDYKIEGSTVRPVRVARVAEATGESPDVRDRYS
jgi:hypothetical protein